MRDFEESTLWRVSEFERVRQETGHSGFARLGHATVLPTTLVADLRRLDRGPDSGDVLEIVAACVRHRESALLCLEIDGLVWPVTLFPQQMLYHSPRDFAEAPLAALAQLRMLAAEPPGVRPPGHWMHERVGAAEHYRELVPLLWRLSLYGPRRELLQEIDGRAAYRLMPSRLGPGPLPSGGALGPALQRLQQETSPLREIASGPGMTIERASRMLNALYLSGGLLVSRSHPSAREPAPAAKGLFRKK